MLNSLQATALLSLENLKSNLLVTQKIAPYSRRVVIVKAQLYGHLLDEVLQTIHTNLNNQEVLAVTDIDSAVSIRKKLPNRRILLLHGISNLEEAQECYFHNLETIVHHPSQIELAKKTQKKESPSPFIWIKVDSGMHRLGFTLDQITQHFSEISALNPHALFSHLSNADSPSDQQNQQQITQFSAIQKSFPDVAYTSLSNSATLLNQLIPFNKKEYIRPGIMIYGLSPNPIEKHHTIDKSLKPALSFFAPIISLKTIKKGSFVGYGGSWQCPKDGTLAVIKVGYADGYSRLLGNRSSVYLNGQPYPVVGHVSMDLITVYFNKQTNCPPPKLGDFVELWGEHICLYSLSKKAQTIPYEILTGLADRVCRKIQQE